MLSSQLHATTEILPLAGLDRLAEHLPTAWIEEALAATGTASIRRRRLPAEQVVWLVIALALYRHQSMPEVLAALDLALPSATELPVSKSAVTQARQRLGAAALEWLFHQTAHAWCRQDAERHDWQGLSLWAMDGTTFRTPDSADNRAHFGAQAYASGKVASYPQVRAVSVTAIHTHLVSDIAFGEYGQNEMLYAKTLIGRIADHSLTVFDRGFLCAEILLGLTLSGQERHYLIPAKSNTKWEVLSGSADDCLVRMRVSPQARAKAPELPEHWVARAVRTVSANGKQRILLTSLLDRRRFKADTLAACYRRRWEIETSYRELKQSMLGHGTHLAQPTAGRGRAGNLGRVDCLQPRAPGNGQGRSSGTRRTDRSQFPASAAYPSTRNDLGRRHGSRKAASPSRSPAHPVAIRHRRKTTGASMPPSRQSPAKTLYRQIPQERS